MDVIFTYPREKFESGALSSKDILELIQKHQNDMVPDMKKCMDYYLGKHAIEEKKRTGNSVPNAKTVCNHAKDIADTASGYFMGNPITYGKGEDEVKPLVEALDYATIDDDDMDNALTLSICGRTYEYVYAAEEEAMLKVQPVDPITTFIVRDESIEHRELFGVYYYSKKEKGSNKTKFHVLICTDSDLIEYEIESGEKGDVAPKHSEPHMLGSVPIIEYKNNKYGIGDFEQQIGLIDAYNTLMADRVNDKEQFIDAVLVLYGQMLGDDPEESAKAMDELRKNKLLEMDEGARAEFLTRTFDEVSVETLRKALKEDIYTFSHVPNLTDENFAGNSSGVAMEFKLLGLEMLTKIKERHYRMGLSKRIKIFCRFLNLQNKNVDDQHAVPVFSRGLPKNILELSQVIANLSGDVSKKTLISLLPFVEDPDDEIEAVKIESAEAIKKHQEMFSPVNSPPETQKDKDVKDDEKS